MPVINSGELHTGARAVDAGWRYRVFSYLPVEFVQSARRRDLRAQRAATRGSPTTTSSATATSPAGSRSRTRRSKPAPRPRSPKPEPLLDALRPRCSRGTRGGAHHPRRFRATPGARRAQ